MCTLDRNFMLFLFFIFIDLLLVFSGYVYHFLGFQLVAIFLLVVFILRLIQANAMVIIPLLGFIFIRATELFSGILIESGGYLTETGVAGVYTGSFIRLPIYYLVFFYSVFCFYSFLNKSFFKSRLSVLGVNKSFLILAGVFSLLVLLSGIFAGFQYGFSFFMGINRFAFREFGGSGLLDFFLNNRFMVIVLASSIFSISMSLYEKIFSISIVIFTILISILHGEQFTSMVSLFLAFFIAPLLIYSINGKNVISKIIGLGLTALFIGAVAVVLVYAQQGFDIKDLAERRLLLQGQLWYVVDFESIGLFSGDLVSFFRNITSFLHLNTAEFKEGVIPYGMRELMYIYALPNIYELYLDNDVTFTMGQMAMLLHWFGYLGMVPVVIFTGMLFSVVILYFNNSILRMDFISILLSCKIFGWFVFGFQQGEYWYVWGAKTIIFMLFVYFFEHFRNSFGLSLLFRR